MQKPVLVSLATLAILAGCASPDSSPTGPAVTAPSFTYDLAVPGNAGDTPARVYLARDAAGNAGKPGGGASLLLWHNGEVMDNAAVTAIYWGSSWSTYQGDKITGLDAFYSGLGGTAYIKTNTEYTGSANTKFGGGVSYGGHVIDASAGPTRAPKVADIQAEVCSQIS